MTTDGANLSLETVRAVRPPLVESGVGSIMFPAEETVRTINRCGARTLVRFAGLILAPVEGIWPFAPSGPLGPIGWGRAEI